MSDAAVALSDPEADPLARARRHVEQNLFAVVGHFTPVTRPSYRLGVPRRGFWKEVMNTNSQFYGGTGLGNDGGKMTEDVPADGFSQSIVLTLPPLSTTIFKWTT